MKNGAFCLILLFVSGFRCGFSVAKPSDVVGFELIEEAKVALAKQGIDSCKAVTIPSTTSSEFREYNFYCRFGFLLSIRFEKEKASSIYFPFSITLGFTPNSTRGISRAMAKAITADWVELSKRTLGLVCKPFAPKTYDGYSCLFSRPPKKWKIFVDNEMKFPLTDNLKDRLAWRDLTVGYQFSFIE